LWRPAPGPAKPGIMTPLLLGAPLCATVVREASRWLGTIGFVRAQPPPRLIKIDVEGYEAGVLDGAWQTLASVRPMVMIETADRLAEAAWRVRSIRAGSARQGRLSPSPHPRRLPARAGHARRRDGRTGELLGRAGLEPRHTVSECERIFWR